MPIGETRPRLAELVESGDLRMVRVDGWDAAAYLDRQARIPRSIDAVSLLSPFDPVVWYRPRAMRLFQFEISHRDFRAGTSAEMGLLRAAVPAG
jgi:hypothetical protein